MRVDPSKPRFTIQRTPTGITVSAPARRSWLILVFLIAWLGGWTAGGASAMSEVMQPGEHQAFLLFWLAGWLMGELYALAIVMWQLAGREELALSRGNLVHRITIGSLGRSREYSGANIRHLRTAPQVGSPWMDQGRWMPPLFGSGHGSIAFDYGARTYRVGSGLDEAEGRLVIAEIQRHFPRMVEGGSG
jgi:hypothetical protein